MARHVYFAFHYQDVIDFRANVVRNRGKLRSGTDIARDGSIWEDYPIKKVKAIKGLIDDALKGNSVTCALIGTETYDRRWVRYELVKSFTENKGLLGVGINWIKGKDGKIKFWPGENPFKYLGLKVSKDGKIIEFFEKKDGGLFGKWVPYNDLKEAKNSRLSSKYYGKEYSFSELFDIYSYNFDDGYKNFDKWVESAVNK